MVRLRGFPLWFLAVLSLAGTLHSDSPNKRIYNGAAVNIADYPYVVSLAIESRHTYTLPSGFVELEQGFGACAGSIVNTRWILSVAHCVSRCVFYPCTISARSGSTFHRRGGSLHNCDLALIHKEYKVNTSGIDTPEHDISLLHYCEVNLFAKAIPLTQVPPAVGNYATAVGWANSTECGSNYTDQLKSVTLSVVKSDLCQFWFKNTPLEITEGMICVGYPPLTMGVSSGDSGGPLVINGTLFGITSWAIPCNYPDYPQVYVNVSHYRGWIDQTIQLTEEKLGQQAFLSDVYVAFLNQSKLKHL